MSEECTGFWRRAIYSRVAFWCLEFNSQETEINKQVRLLPGSSTLPFFLFLFFFSPHFLTFIKCYKTFCQKRKYKLHLQGSSFVDYKNIVAVAVKGWDCKSLMCTWLSLNFIKWQLPLCKIQYLQGKMQHILLPSLFVMANQSVVTLNLNCRLMRIVGRIIFVGEMLGHTVFYFYTRALGRQYQSQSLHQWLFSLVCDLCSPLNISWRSQNPCKG